jgi:hypothetical protein
MKFFHKNYTGSVVKEEIMMKLTLILIFAVITIAMKQNKFNILHSNSSSCPITKKNFKKK